MVDSISAKGLCNAAHCPLIQLAWWAREASPGSSPGQCLPQPTSSKTTQSALQDSHYALGIFIAFCLLVRYAGRRVNSLQGYLRECPPRPDVRRKRSTIETRLNQLALFDSHYARGGVRPGRPQGNVHCLPTFAGNEIQE